MTQPKSIYPVLTEQQKKFGGVDAQKFRLDLLTPGREHGYENGSTNGARQRLSKLMRTNVRVLTVVALLVAYSSPVIHAATWELVWSDEFNGPAINRSNWTYDTGGGGWGNNELEYYTDRPENSRVENGMLVIEARKERVRNRDYTSARLKTQGLQNWTHGRIEASIKVPNGQGVWPAFWMLGSNFPDIGWPNCGEIDIMEHVLPIGVNTVRGSAHGPNYSGANSLHGDVILGDLSGRFHVFAIEWEPNQIRWYVDDIQYFSVTPPLPGSWVFDQPFFIILNLAIGGDWPGAPDATTGFPVQMLVDYVKVFRGPNPPPPVGAPLGGSIAISWISSGPNWEAVATVTVKDGSNAAVSGVNVLGAWSGLTHVGVTQKSTDGNGVAVLNSGKVRKSGTISFCITDLVKSGYSYAPPAGGSCSQITH